MSEAGPKRNLASLEPNDDPFALGGRQAIPSFDTLWKENEALTAEIEQRLAAGADVDSVEISAMLDRSGDIEDEIAGGIATDKAGLVAQLQLLQRHHRMFMWDDWGDKLVDNLIAGAASIEASQ